MRRLPSCLVHVCSVLALCAIAEPASAQPDRGTVFIGAGALASLERSPRTSGLGIDSDSDGAAPGGALSLGVYLTPRVSARFEWSITGWLEHENGYDVYPLYLASALALSDGGQADPALVQSLFAPYSFRSRSRSKSGFALLGYHLGSRRASIEMMGGMGWVAKTTRTSYDIQLAQRLVALPANTLPFRAGESRYTDYQTVGVAGLDAEVGLTGQAAVVPQLRVFASGGSLTLRPGVGIRWKF